MRGQEDWRGKLWGELIRQVEIDVEAPEVARLVMRDLVDLLVGEHLSAGGLLDVRQRLETVRQQPLVADFVGAHSGEAIPGLAGRQLDAHAALYGFASA